MKRCIKIIISVCLVCALMIGSTTTANAVGNNRFAAWILAALQAANITLTATLAPAQELLYYMEDPLQVVYTYPEQQLDNYFDQSVISIYPGATIIDGVSYSDVWLSNNAAQKFRTNAFDFESAYNIVSNTNGTFAEGLGYLDGIPFFRVNNSVRSQNIYLTSGIDTYSVGNVTLSGVRYSSDYYKPKVTFSDNSSKTSTSSYKYPLTTYFYDVGNQDISLHCQAYSGSPLQGNVHIGDKRSLWESDPFDFDYIAGTIYPSTLDPDDGLKIQVPDSLTQPILTDHPSAQEPGGTIININMPSDLDLVAQLGDLIAQIMLDPTIIAPVVYAPQPEVPVPVPPEPAPGTLIQDTPWENLRYKIDKIIEHITNIPQSMLDDIEQGPIKVMDKALDLLKTIFAPIFLLLKNALGIWHYVIEWLSQISAPMTFMLGILSNTGGFMLPIYASIAGYIVIAVYKHFGR